MIDLYHHGSSVCAAKVRFALGEKNLAWEGHYLDILKGDQFAPEYQRLNSKAVVPTLVHDGNVIVELTVINEYLDETFSNVPSASPPSPASMRCPTIPAARRRATATTRAIPASIKPPPSITRSCSRARSTR